MVEKDARLYLLFNSMFDQVPNKTPYNENPAGERQIRDFDHMLTIINHILTTPPFWNDKEHSVGIVGTPFQGIFDWPMGTPSGFAVFQDPQVNRILKEILNQWGQFLKSPESAKVLRAAPDGWFGPEGKKDLTQAANAATETSHSFEDMFYCDPKAETHGFTSWDNFFTRQFREGMRPVASPERDDIIANCCESKPYKVAYDVKARDKYWIKGQPYSVLDMLAHDEYAPQFVGGTIYQAFLSALSYHRWHSPVTGTIVKTYVQDGTYFSEPPYTGFEDSPHMDTAGENTGQEYLTALATRAMIFIKADNPKIGLLCVLAVGMVEVSTCDVTVQEGQHVKKGDQRKQSQFHFGGSTHCVLFRKGVKLQGFPLPGRPTNVPVRSQLAEVVD